MARLYTNENSLHQQFPEHPDIVVYTFDPDFVGQAHRIHAQVQGRETLSGCLLRVNRPGQ